MELLIIVIVLAVLGHHAHHYRRNRRNGFGVFYSLRGPWGSRIRITKRL